MKYVVEIELNLPRKKVIELFDNPKNMPKWQPDLVSFDHISGQPGKEGAKSKLVYKMGKRDVEMVETITKNALPDELLGTYVAKGVYNVISNRFEELDKNRTLWISDNEFKFTGVFKVVSLFMKGSFPKQTLKFMNQFKDFAENYN